MQVPTKPLRLSPSAADATVMRAILLSSFFLLSLLTGCAQSKWQLQEAKSGSGGNTNRNTAPGQPPDKNACINLASQGGNLQGAIDNAKNTAAQCVYVPPGTHNFGGHISINGVKLIGDGDSSILYAIHSAGASLQLQGTGGGIYSLRVVTRLDNRCATGVRCEGRTANDFAIFIANRANKWVVNNVTIDGSRALGIQIFGAHDGRITNNRIMNTMAGGIHLTNGAYNVYVAGNTAHNVADDEFGVACGYQQNGVNCHDILIENNYGENQPFGRGILVHSGKNITIRNNKIVKAAGSGIMINSETEQNAFEVDNILVENNTIDQSPSALNDSYSGSIREMVQGGPVSNVQYTNNEITNSGNVPFFIDSATSNNFCKGNTYNGSPISPSNCSEGTGSDITGAGIDATILGGTTVVFPKNDNRD